MNTVKIGIIRNVATGKNYHAIRIYNKYGIQLAELLLTEDDYNMLEQKDIPLIPYSERQSYTSQPPGEGGE